MLRLVLKSVGLLAIVCTFVPAFGIEVLPVPARRVADSVAGKRANTAPVTKPPAMRLQRQVFVNISIDDRVMETAVQLKKRAGDVLMKVDKAVPEKLELEVVIRGPCGDVSTLVPIPCNSVVYQAYEKYKEGDPDDMIAVMTQLRVPSVDVISQCNTYDRETFESGRLVCRRPIFEWRPYYRICFPGTDCGPVMIPVPQADGPMQTMAKRAVNTTPATEPGVIYVTHILGDSCTECGPTCAPGCNGHSPH